MKAKSLPDADYLAECFTYVADTGILLWNARPDKHFLCKANAETWNAKYPGTRAGWQMKTGHVAVSVDGGKYLVHRIVWRMVTGDDPGNLEIDHRNNIRNDNKWANLRLATSLQQSANKLRSPKNTSGYKGVSWDNANQKWRASICINRKTINLGRYLTVEEAFSAYGDAAEKAFGKFKRLN